MELIITDEFREIFPEAGIAVITASGIDNTVYRQPAGEKPIDALLSDACADAEKYFELEPLSANPAVAAWRAAFQKFKTKKGARSSIEALLARVKKGNPPGRINPLVDIYNAMSLSYGLPCGGEDTDNIRGDMRLTLARGGEPFTAIGETEDDPALSGEVAYLDDAGAVCRCWNWRDGQRTMLTEATKNAVLVIECVDPARFPDLEEALSLLSAYVEKYLGGKTSTMIYK
jgi:DNA/RNA-binding domain of Phe-tRNA-synthetase-like protein